MKRHSLLTILVMIAMMAIMTTTASADGSQKSRSHAAQTSPAICFVNGHFYLTPAEGLRRVGSWTVASSASNECPSASASVNVALGWIGSWARP